QEFAFYLHDVGEIVRVPDDISALPDSNPSVLGLVNLRGRIIPIVDLAMNLGMQPCEMNDATRIIIVNCSDSSQSAVGFVVAKVSNVVSISPSALEPVPSMCNDGYTDGALEAVYRVEGTKRLISIVNLHSVFQRSLSQALSQVDLQDEVSDMANQDEGVLTEEDYAQYVIFSIAGQEYGVSIEDTQEITRIPDKLESVPNTPDYLQGIVNLRGTVLPVIDLRTRLGLPKAEATDRQRIVVLTRNKQKTGFIVDGVAEVKTVITDSIEDAPSLSDEQTELLNKLIKLNKEQRIIQLIEPSVLLNDNDIAKVNGG
ncbi:MAG: chemotaxis protein CheW, partial [Pseudomonadota bacterium]|nr:chemotaxis protein CheW [Pseudomonadota bacterium]